MIPLKQLRTEMREASEKATPWNSDDDCVRYSPDSYGPDQYLAGPHTYDCVEYHHSMGLPTQQAVDTGAFIALANPANLKRLLDALDASEEALTAEKAKTAKLRNALIYCVENERTDLSDSAYDKAFLALRETK